MSWKLNSAHRPAGLCGCSMHCNAKLHLLISRYLQMLFFSDTKTARLSGGLLSSPRHSLTKATVKYAHKTHRSEHVHGPVGPESLSRTCKSSCQHILSPFLGISAARSGTRHTIQEKRDGTLQRSQEPWHCKQMLLKHQEPPSTAPN